MGTTDTSLEFCNKLIEQTFKQYRTPKARGHLNRNNILRLSKRHFPSFIEQITVRNIFFKYKFKTAKTMLGYKRYNSID